MATKTRPRSKAKESGNARQREINRSFGRRVERRARELDRSLRQIAEQAEMDPSFLSRIVTGERNPPSDEIIERLAKALEMPGDDLFLEAGRLPDLSEGTKKTLPDFFRASKRLSEEQIRTVIRTMETVFREEEK